MLTLTATSCIGQVDPGNSDMDFLTTLLPPSQPITKSASSRFVVFELGSSTSTHALFAFPSWPARKTRQPQWKVTPGSFRTSSRSKADKEPTGRITVCGRPDTKVSNLSSPIIHSPFGFLQDASAGMKPCSITLSRIPARDRTLERTHQLSISFSFRNIELDI